MSTRTGTRAARVQQEARPSQKLGRARGRKNDMTVPSPRVKRTTIHPVPRSTPAMSKPNLRTPSVTYGQMRGRGPGLALSSTATRSQSSRRWNARRTKP